MAHTTAVIANAFLHNAKGRHITINHMKLQKLMFFGHVWSLTIDGESIMNERPQAWAHGPIFESIYYRLQILGKRPIVHNLTSFNPVAGTHCSFIPANEDAKVWNIINQVMVRYGFFSDLQLSTLAHEVNGPWYTAHQNQKLYVQDEDIKLFYGAILEQHFKKAA